MAPASTGSGASAAVTERTGLDVTVVVVEPATGAVWAESMLAPLLVRMVPVASGFATRTTSCADPEAEAASVPIGQVTTPADSVPPPGDVFDVSRTPICDPLAETERREDLKRLVEDVRRLPTQQRSVLLMRELEGLPYSELAEAMDVSVAAVKSLLVRARMGLVESAEARDAACSEIRHDLTIAHGRGVRANGRARRHLRDCASCREYRSELRSPQEIAGFFAGLELVEPGVVSTSRWRPEPSPWGAPAEIDAFCGVGRKG